MRPLSLIALLASVLASVATSRGEPNDEEPPGGRVHLYASSAATVEVRVATNPNCDLLVGAPWLAVGVVFAELPSEIIELEAEAPQPILATNDGSYCQVLEVRSGEHRAVMFVGPERLYDVYETYPVAAERVRFGTVVLDSEGGFLDGGAGLVQNPADTDVCEPDGGVSWSAVELDQAVVDDVFLEQGCTGVIAGEAGFTVCGTPLPLAKGDVIKVVSDDSGFDLLVEGGAHVRLGRHLGEVSLSFTFDVSDVGCIEQLPCGGRAQVDTFELDGVPLALGQPLVGEDSTLTVLEAWAAISDDCPVDAVYRQDL